MALIHKLNMITIIKCSILLLCICSIRADPTLTILPGDRVVRSIGDSVFFTCQIDGLIDIQNPDYKWYDATGEQVSWTSAVNRLYISYDLDTHLYLRLYIMNIIAKDAGNYRCEATVEGNRISKIIQLAVFKDITFDHAPSPQHPIQNTNALIECRVSGDPTPEVSWIYRGLRLKPTGGRYSFEQGGLRVLNVTTADNGLYTCQAEVVSSSKIKAAVIEVTIYTKPVIRAVPRVDGIEGHDTSFVCLADGYPTPKYDFYKDGNPNPAIDTERINVDNDGGVINFRPLSVLDDGTYECHAINDAGDARMSGILFVNVPPRLDQMVNRTMIEGGNGYLQCSVIAKPPALMSFRKLGGYYMPPLPYIPPNPYDYELGSNEGGRIIVSQPEPNKLLIQINGMTPEDSSNYTCKASNAGGSMMRNGTLVTQYSPRFAPDAVTKFYNWAGRRRNMTCWAMGEPEPLVVWTRFNWQIKNNETYRVFQMGRHSELEVNIQEWDQTWIYGGITCRATNEFGQAELVINLARAYVPDVPKMVTARVVTPSTIVLEVVPPDNDGGMEVYGYQIDYGGAQGQRNTAKVNIGDEIKLVNLMPYTRYMFAVRARNEVGVGQPREYTVTTAPQREPYPPFITSDPISPYPYQYTVMWNWPEDGGLPIREYEFRFQRVSVLPGTSIFDKELEPWQLRTQFTNFDSTKSRLTFYMMEELEPQSYYRIRIRARNDIGWSLPNEDFLFKTANGVPKGRPSVSSGWTPVHDATLTLTSLLAALAVSQLY